MHDLHAASKTSLVRVIFVAKATSIHGRCLKLLCDVTYLGIITLERQIVSAVNRALRASLNC